MILTRNSKYRRAIIALLALYCLLLPNSAVPPQGSTDAPCSVQQEPPSLISTPNPQHQTQLNVAGDEDDEHPTAHQGDLPGSSLPALDVSASASLDSGVARSAMKPESHTAFSREEAAEVPEPHLMPHSPEGAQSYIHICMHKFKNKVLITLSTFSLLQNKMAACLLLAGLLESPGAFNHTPSKVDGAANISPPAEVQHMPASDGIAGTQTESTSDSSVQVRPSANLRFTASHNRLGLTLSCASECPGVGSVYATE